jgi:D-alanyl-D-alanine carboxypeptidase
MVSLSHRARFRLFFAASLAATLAVLSPGTATGVSDDNPDMARRLETVLKEAMTASGSPGAIAGVWKGNFVWRAARGLADVRAGTPMQTSQVWRIGSVTKTFTATAVLRLIDQGKLSLDDRLSRFRPDFPRADRITVRQLLQHSSGIFSWDEDDATRAAIYRHPDREWTTETMIRLAAGKPFYFEPGAGFHYSNTGYFLLASIIERATGKGLAQVLREEVTEPLGLRHTYLPDGPRYEDEVIRGYMTEAGALEDTTGLRFADVINYDLAQSAGGMVSTLDDLNVWIRALATGRLLSKRMHTEQLRVIPIPSSQVKGIGYGLGVNVNTSTGWLGHSGGVTGAMCNVYIHPEADAVIIQFFNKLDPVDENQNAADTKALGDAILGMMRIAVPGSE